MNWLCRGQGDRTALVKVKYTNGNISKKLLAIVEGNKDGDSSGEDDSDEEENGGNSEVEYSLIYFDIPGMEIQISDECQMFIFNAVLTM